MEHESLNSNKGPGEAAAAAARTTLWEPVVLISVTTRSVVCVCKSKKLANTLLQTTPPPLCLKVCLVIKRELPNAHSTFLHADSESDLRLVLHPISSLAH